MVKKKYIPKRGDVVWVDLNPTKGREQANKRPVLVLSPNIYNKKSGLIIVCPITTKIKNYPFEVKVAHHDRESVVLVDQIRALDWQRRQIELFFATEDSVVKEVQAKLSLLVL